MSDQHKGQTNKKSDKNLPKLPFQTEENQNVSEHENNVPNNNFNQTGTANNNNFNQTFNLNVEKKHNKTNSVIYKPRIWDLQPPEKKGVSVRKKVLEMRETFQKEKKEQDKIKTEAVNIICEANKIMKERNRNNGIAVTSKTKSIKEYILDNKEINCKNYLIGLLKGERTYINDKEMTIAKDLKKCEQQLDLSLHHFNEYSEKEKNITKANEQILLELINKNKVSIAKKKLLIVENKKIFENLERRVRDINSQRSYNNFVQEVIGGKKRSKFPTERGEISGRNKEQELVKETEKIIEEFGGQMKNDADLLEDSERLMSKFQMIEENIIKIMDKKYLIELEKEKLEKDYKIENEDLENREKLVKDEYNILVNEHEKLIKIIKNLEKQKNDVGYISEIESLIEEIYKVNDFSTAKINNNAKTLKNKEVNIVKDVLDDLKLMEKQILNDITTLEFYQEENHKLLLGIVDKRKDRNKDEKQKILIEKQEKLNEERKKKTEERMNKIIIKGRKIQLKTILKKASSKKKNDTDKNEEEDANDMLELQTNDNY